MIIFFVLGIIIILGIALYQPFINYMITQSANPKGIIGNVMTKIWSGYFENQTQWGLSLIDLNEYDTILNVGYGSGAGFEKMNENGDAKLYGIDVSEEAYKAASRSNKNAIDDGSLILAIGDVADLPYKSNFFNLIIAEQTHIYWEELEKGLSECYRKLQGNGILLITCEIDKINYHTPQYRDSDIFIEALSEIGFSTVRMKIEDNYIAFVCSK